MKRLVLMLIRGYQLLLSPLVGGACRFEPSCSRYAMACVEHHGVLRGGLLSVRRLLRCHPFHPGGFDPPPLPTGASRGPRGSLRDRSPCAHAHDAGGSRAKSALLPS